MPLLRPVFLGSFREESEVETAACLTFFGLSGSHLTGLLVSLPCDIQFYCLAIPVANLAIAGVGRVRSSMLTAINLQ